MAEDEMVGWHHQHTGHEFEKTPGDSEGQGSLVHCSLWGCKDSNTTTMLKEKRLPTELVSQSCLVMSDSLPPHGLYSPWNSPGQSTEVGRLSLLQAIFPTQGSNLGLPHGRQILYQLSHQGSPYTNTYIYLCGHPWWLRQ